MKNLYIILWIVGITFYFIDSNKFNSVIRFNDKDGEIEVGSGMTFGEVLDYIVPHSFFLPITPGTQFATIGGGLANDVHGKNHHIQGSLGNHAISFKILREGKIFLLQSHRSGGA